MGTIRNTTTLRRNLRAAFGIRKYRITKAGEVQVYGKMPNSIQTGWYFFGHDSDTRTHIDAESRAGNFA